MKTLVRIIALVGISLISLFATRPVLAFPPLPSSFYGTVKVNGANVPDGTLVKAYINGQMYAQAQSQTYQNGSVYSLDAVGDDSSTTTIEGGQDGDTIVFRIGEDVANETGKWESGTNVNLNLSVTTTATRNTPIPTKTPTAVIIPEQTAVLSTPVPPATLTTGVLPQVSPSPTALIQPTLVKPTELMQATQAMPSALNQSTPAIPTMTNLENIVVGSRSNIITIEIVGSVLILFVILWLIFGHKPKA